MQTLSQLLKSRTVLFALFLAILSILQGYVNLLPLSPTDQMFVGIAIGCFLLFTFGLIISIIVENVQREKKWKR